MDMAQPTTSGVLSHMLLEEPLPFIKDYVNKLNEAIKIYCPERQLSLTQQAWLSFCVMAIIVTNSVCRSRFQKAGIGRYEIGALSWAKALYSWF